MRAIWTCPLCGWRQPDDRPRICGRNGEPCSGDRSWMPALSSEVQPVGSERSDDERSVHADPLDTSRHVDGAGWRNVIQCDFDRYFAGTEWLLVVTNDGRRTIAKPYKSGEHRFWVAGTGPNLSDPRWPCEFLPFSVAAWMPLPEPPAALAQPSPLDTSGRVEGGEGE